jgi:hypothetical protein
LERRQQDLSVVWRTSSGGPASAGRAFAAAGALIIIPPICDQIGVDLPPRSVRN